MRKQGEALKSDAQLRIVQPWHPNHSAISPASTSTTLQDRIVAALELRWTAGRFREDSWQREGGGGGRTRVLADGSVFEKAGVNFSEVYGQMSRGVRQASARRGPRLHRLRHLAGAASAQSDGADRPRQFSLPHQGRRQWFGGGADLTPYYPYPRGCDSLSQGLAATSARATPRWSIMPHSRNGAMSISSCRIAAKPRGVGGIFFDYLEGDLEALFDFVRDCGDRFLEAYLPIAAAAQGSNRIRERERAFQEFRRGRYVEFNLLYDRGTLFGLKTGGRTESILMSLPPRVRWVYDYRPEPGIARGGVVRGLSEAARLGGGRGVTGQMCLAAGAIKQPPQGKRKARQPPARPVSDCFVVNPLHWSGVCIDLCGLGRRIDHPYHFYIYLENTRRFCGRFLVWCC